MTVYWFLKIISDYAKNDNESKIGKEYDLEQTDFIINELKQKKKSKYEIG
jgi:hypothetical protein